MGRLSPFISSTTLAIFILLVTCSTPNHAAPVQDNAASRYANEKGCYFMNQHYETGHEIETNDPCMNCTCTGDAMMCYLRICPFIKPLGENCKMEKHVGDCCPKYWCPEVYPRKKIPKPDTETKGCYMNGLHYEEGYRLPIDPLNPCHACYCIKNVSVCTNETCELHIPGCFPRYKIGSCCPEKYECTDEAATTIPPSVLEAETPPPGCNVDGVFYEDGVQVPSNETCKKCYCMRHQVMCTAIECTAPGTHCVPHEVLDGQCCPEKYDCPEDTQISEFATTHMVSTEEEFLNLTTTHLPPASASFSISEDQVDFVTKDTFATVETEQIYSTTKGVRRIDEEETVTIVPGFAEESTTEGTSITISGPRIPKITEIPEDLFTKPRERRPIFFPSRPIPGEGVCRHVNKTYQHGEEVESNDPCRENCTCVHSVVKCDIVECVIDRPTPGRKCKVKVSADECCPKYICDIPSSTTLSDETEVPGKDVTEDIFIKDRLENITESDIATMQAETVTDKPAVSEKITDLADSFSQTTLETTKSNETVMTTKMPFSITTSKEILETTDKPTDETMSETLPATKEKFTSGPESISTTLQSFETMTVSTLLSTTGKEKPSTTEESGETEKTGTIDEISTTLTTKEKFSPHVDSESATPQLLEAETLTIPTRITEKEFEEKVTTDIEKTTTPQAISEKDIEPEITSKKGTIMTTTTVFEAETVSIPLKTTEKEKISTTVESGKTEIETEKTGMIDKISTTQTTKEKVTPHVDSVSTTPQLLEAETFTMSTHIREEELEEKVTKEIEDITTPEALSEKDIETEITSKKGTIMTTATGFEAETVSLPLRTTVKEKISTTEESVKTEKETEKTGVVGEISTIQTTKQEITPHVDSVSTTPQLLEAETFTMSTHKTEEELEEKVTKEIGNITTPEAISEKDIETEITSKKDTIRTTATVFEAETVSLPLRTTVKEKISTTEESVKTEIETEKTGVVDEISTIQTTKEEITPHVDSVSTTPQLLEAETFTMSTHITEEELEEKVIKEIENITAPEAISEKDIETEIASKKDTIMTTATVFEAETVSVPLKTTEKEKLSTTEESGRTGIETEKPGMIDKISTTQTTKEKVTPDVDSASTTPQLLEAETFTMSTHITEEELEEKVTKEIENITTPEEISEKDIETEITSKKDTIMTTATVFEAETVSLPLRTTVKEKISTTEESVKTEIETEKTGVVGEISTIQTTKQEITPHVDSVSTTPQLLEAKTFTMSTHKTEEELEEKVTEEIGNITTPEAISEKGIETEITSKKESTITTATVFEAETVSVTLRTTEKERTSATDESKTSEIETKTTEMIDEITLSSIETITPKIANVSGTPQLSEAETVSMPTHVTEKIVEEKVTDEIRGITTPSSIPEKDIEAEITTEKASTITSTTLFVTETASASLQTTVQKQPTTTAESEKMDAERKGTEIVDIITTKLDAKGKVTPEIDSISTTPSLLKAETVTMPTHTTEKELQEKVTDKIEKITTPSSITESEKPLKGSVMTTATLFETEAVTTPLKTSETYKTTTIKESTEAEAETKITDRIDTITLPTKEKVTPEIQSMFGTPQLLEAETVTATTHVTELEEKVTDELEEKPTSPEISEKDKQTDIISEKESAITSTTLFETEAVSTPLKTTEKEKPATTEESKKTEIQTKITDMVDIIPTTLPAKEKVTPEIDSKPTTPQLLETETVSMITHVTETEKSVTDDIKKFTTLQPVSEKDIETEITSKKESTLMSTTLSETEAVSFKTTEKEKPATIEESKKETEIDTKITEMIHIITTTLSTKEKVTPEIESTSSTPQLLEAETVTTPTHVTEINLEKEVTDEIGKITTPTIISEDVGVKITSKKESTITSTTPSDAEDISTSFKATEKEKTAATKESIKTETETKITEKIDIITTTPPSKEKVTSEIESMSSTPQFLEAETVRMKTLVTDIDHEVTDVFERITTQETDEIEKVTTAPEISEEDKESKITTVRDSLVTTTALFVSQTDSTPPRTTEKEKATSVAEISKTEIETKMTDKIDISTITPRTKEEITLEIESMSSTPQLLEEDTATMPKHVTELEEKVTDKIEKITTPPSVSEKDIESDITRKKESILTTTIAFETPTVSTPQRTTERQETTTIEERIKTEIETKMTEMADIITTKLTTKEQVTPEIVNISSTPMVFEAETVTTTTHAVDLDLEEKVTGKIEKFTVSTPISEKDIEAEITSQKESAITGTTLSETEAASTSLKETEKDKPATTEESIEMELKTKKTEKIDIITTTAPTKGKVTPEIESMSSTPQFLEAETVKTQTHVTELEEKVTDKIEKLTTPPEISEEDVETEVTPEKETIMATTTMFETEFISTPLKTTEKDKPAVIEERNETEITAPPATFIDDIETKITTEKESVLTTTILSETETDSKPLRTTEKEKTTIGEIHKTEMEMDITEKIDTIATKQPTTEEVTSEIAIMSSTPHLLKAETVTMPTHATELELEKEVTDEIENTTTLLSISEKDVESMITAEKDRIMTPTAVFETETVSTTLATTEKEKTTTTEEEKKTETESEKPELMDKISTELSIKEKITPEIERISSTPQLLEAETVTTSIQVTEIELERNVTDEIKEITTRPITSEEDMEAEITSKKEITITSTTLLETEAVSTSVKTTEMEKPVTTEESLKTEIETKITEKADLITTALPMKEKITPEVESIFTTPQFLEAETVTMPTHVTELEEKVTDEIEKITTLPASSEKDVETEITPKKETLGTTTAVFETESLSTPLKEIEKRKPTIIEESDKTETEMEITEKIDITDTTLLSRETVTPEIESMSTTSKFLEKETVTQPTHVTELEDKVTDEIKKVTIPPTIPEKDIAITVEKDSAVSTTTLFEAETVSIPVRSTEKEKIFTTQESDKIEIGTEETEIIDELSTTLTTKGTKITEMVEKISITTPIKEKVTPETESKSTTSELLEAETVTMPSHVTLKEVKTKATDKIDIDTTPLEIKEKDIISDITPEIVSITTTASTFEDKTKPQVTTGEEKSATTVEVSKTEIETKITEMMEKISTTLPLKEKVISEIEIVPTTPQLLLGETITPSTHVTEKEIVTDEIKKSTIPPTVEEKGIESDKTVTKDSTMTTDARLKTETFSTPLSTTEKLKTPTIEESDRTESETKLTDMMDEINTTLSIEEKFTPEIDSMATTPQLLEAETVKMSLPVTEEELEPKITDEIENFTTPLEIKETSTEAKMTPDKDRTMTTATGIETTTFSTPMKITEKKKTTTFEESGKTEIEMKITKIMDDISTTLPTKEKSTPEIDSMFSTPQLLETEVLTTPAHETEKELETKVADDIENITSTSLEKDLELEITSKKDRIMTTATVSQTESVSTPQTVTEKEKTTDVEKSSKTDLEAKTTKSMDEMSSTLSAKEEVTSETDIIPTTPALFHAETDTPPSHVPEKELEPKVTDEIQNLTTFLPVKEKDIATEITSEKDSIMITTSEFGRETVSTPFKTTEEEKTTIVEESSKSEIDTKITEMMDEISTALSTKEQVTSETKIISTTPRLFQTETFTTPSHVTEKELEEKVTDESEITTVVSESEEEKNVTKTIKETTISVASQTSQEPESLDEIDRITTRLISDAKDLETKVTLVPDVKTSTTAILEAETISSFMTTGEQKESKVTEEKIFTEHFPSEKTKVEISSKDLGEFASTSVFQTTSATTITQEKLVTESTISASDTEAIEAVEGHSTFSSAAPTDEDDLKVKSFTESESISTIATTLVSEKEMFPEIDSVTDATSQTEKSLSTSEEEITLKPFSTISTSDFESFSENITLAETFTKAKTEDIGIQTENITTLDISTPKSIKDEIPEAPKIEASTLTAKSYASEKTLDDISFQSTDLPITTMHLGKTSTSQTVFEKIDTVEMLTSPIVPELISERTDKTANQTASTVFEFTTTASIQPDKKDQTTTTISIPKDIEEHVTPKETDHTIDETDIVTDNLFTPMKQTPDSLIRLETTVLSAEAEEITVRPSSEISEMPKNITEKDQFSDQDADVTKTTSVPFSELSVHKITTQATPLEVATSTDTAFEAETSSVHILTSTEEQTSTVTLFELEKEILARKPTTSETRDMTESEATLKTNITTTEPSTSAAVEKVSELTSIFEAETRTPQIADHTSFVAVSPTETSTKLEISKEETKESSTSETLIVDAVTFTTVEDKQITEKSQSTVRDHATTLADDDAKTQSISIKTSYSTSMETEKLSEVTSFSTMLPTETTEKSISTTPDQRLETKTTKMTFDSFITTSPKKGETLETELTMSEAETTVTEHSVITEETIASNATFAADAMLKPQTTTIETSTVTDTSIHKEDTSSTTSKTKIATELTTTEPKDEIFKTTTEKTTIRTDTELDLTKELSSERELGISTISTFATPDSKRADFTRESVHSTLQQATRTSTLHAIMEAEKATTTAIEEVTTHIPALDITKSSVTTKKEFDEITESTFITEFDNKTKEQQETLEAETGTYQTEAATTVFAKKDKTTLFEETPIPTEFTSEKDILISKTTPSSTRLDTSISTEKSTEIFEVKTTSIASETVTEPSTEISDFYPDIQISSRRDQKVEDITPEKETQLPTKVLDMTPTTSEGIETSFKLETDLKTSEDVSTISVPSRIPITTEKTLLITDSEVSEMHPSTEATSTVSDLTKIKTPSEPFTEITHKTETGETPETVGFSELITEKPTISDDEKVFTQSLKPFDVTKESIEIKTTLKHETVTEEMASETQKEFSEKEEVSSETSETIPELGLSTIPRITTTVFDVTKTKETDFKPSTITEAFDSKASASTVTEKSLEVSESILSTDRTTLDEMQAEKATSLRPIVTTDLESKDFTPVVEEKTSATLFKEDMTPDVSEDDSLKTEGECTVNGTSYKDGEAIATTDPCEKCHCSLGEINCFKILCKLPQKNCIPRFNSTLACCPSSYECPEKEEEKASTIFFRSASETDLTTPIPISFMFSTTPKSIASTIMITKSEDKEQAEDVTVILHSDKLSTSDETTTPTKIVTGETITSTKTSTGEIITPTESDISVTTLSTKKVVSDTTVDLKDSKPTEQAETPELISDISLKEIETTETSRATEISVKEIESVSTTEKSTEIFESDKPLTLSAESEASSEVTTEKSEEGFTIAASTIRKDIDITDVTKQPTETPTTFDTIRTTFADMHKEKEDEMHTLFESTTILSSESDEKVSDLTTIFDAKSTLKEETETEPSSVTSDPRIISEKPSKESTTVKVETEPTRDDSVSFDKTSTSKIFEVTEKEKPMFTDTETTVSSEESVTELAETSKSSYFTEDMTTFTVMPSKLPKLDDIITSKESITSETEQHQETTKDARETEKTETMATETSMTTGAQDISKDSSTTAKAQDTALFDVKPSTVSVITEKEETEVTLSSEEISSSETINKTTEELQLRTEMETLSTEKSATDTVKDDTAQLITKSLLTTTGSEHEISSVTFKPVTDEMPIKEKSDFDIEMPSTTFSPLKEISTILSEKTTHFDISTELFEVNKTLESRDRKGTVSILETETEFSSMLTDFTSTRDQVSIETTTEKLEGKKGVDGDIAFEMKDDTEEGKSTSPVQDITAIPREKVTDQEIKTEVPMTISTATILGRNETSFTRAEDAEFPSVSTVFIPISNDTEESREKSTTVTETTPTITDAIFTFVSTRFTDMIKGITELTTAKEETETKDFNVSLKQPTTVSPLKVTTEKAETVTLLSLVTHGIDLDVERATTEKVITQDAETTLTPVTKDKFTTFKDETTAPKLDIKTIKDSDVTTPKIAMTPEAMTRFLTSSTPFELEITKKFVTEETKEFDSESTEVFEVKTTPTRVPEVVENATFSEVITKTSVETERSFAVPDTSHDGPFAEKTDTDIVLPETTTSKIKEETISSLSTQKLEAETLKIENESELTSFTSETKPTTIEMTTENISFDETEPASRATRKDIELEVTPSSITKTETVSEILSLNISTTEEKVAADEFNISSKTTFTVSVTPRVDQSTVTRETTIEHLESLPTTRIIEVEKSDAETLPMDNETITLAPKTLPKEVITTPVSEILNDTKITEKEISPTKIESDASTLSIDTTTGLPTMKTTDKEIISSVAQDAETMKAQTELATEEIETLSTQTISAKDLTSERIMTTQKEEQNLTQPITTQTTLSPRLQTTTTASFAESEETTVKPKITTIVEDAETPMPSVATEGPIVSTQSTREELNATEYVTKGYKTIETTTMKEEDDYIIDENTCIFEGKIFQSAEQIPRPDPCEFCFCFRGDIICLQQSCPPPAPNCHQTTIPGYCCPRYECPVYVTSKNISAMSRRKGVTPIIIQRRIDKREVRKPTIEVQGCQYNGTFYEMGKTVTSASGPCLHCVCQEDGFMHCDPQRCKPQAPLMLKMNNNFFRRR